MTRLSMGLTLGALLASVSAVGMAVGQFVKIDDFESYTVGELQGQGMWTADPGIEVVIESGATNKDIDPLIFRDVGNLAIRGSRADVQWAALGGRVDRNGISCDVRARPSKRWSAIKATMSTLARGR